MVKYEFNVKSSKSWIHIIASNITIKKKNNDTIQQLKKKSLIQKWVMYLSGYFFKEDIQIISEHMKRCWTPLIIVEMQIKTIIIYHFTSIRMAIYQKSRNKQCWWGCEETGILYIAGGNVRWCRCCEKWYAASSKNWR